MICKGMWTRSALFRWVERGDDVLYGLVRGRGPVDPLPRSDGSRRPGDSGMGERALSPTPTDPPPPPPDNTTPHHTTPQHAHHTTVGLWAGSKSMS